MSVDNLKYKQDGPEAEEIAKYLPYFPFKHIGKSKLHTQRISFRCHVESCRRVDGPVVMVHWSI